MEHKSGFVGVVGEPNVGKSTLINRLIKQKIAIISRKPQTTRNRLLAILTEDDYQIVFIDTPGTIKKIRNKLDGFMDEESRAAFSGEVDVVLILISVESLPSIASIKKILSQTAKGNRIMIVINKVDLIAKSKLLEIISRYQELSEVAEIFPISALHGENVDKLLAEIIRVMPEGPVYYPEDIITSASERFVIQEIIREKIFHLLSQEIPYCIAVKTEEVKLRDNGKFYVRAVIFVEHDSQKSIIIGKKGACLKKIGQLGRKDIEALLDASVFLELWVKVEKNWRKNIKGLKKLGYS